MSRFLAYGVFIPSSLDEKANAAGCSTEGGTSLKWTKVGSRWVKIGPDGKPVDPPKPSPPAEPATPQKPDDTSGASFIVGGGYDTGPDDIPCGSSSVQTKLNPGISSSLANSTADSWETTPPTSDSCDDGGTPSSSSGSVQQMSREKWGSSLASSGADEEPSLARESPKGEPQVDLGANRETTADEGNERLLPTPAQFLQRRGSTVGCQAGTYSAEGAAENHFEKGGGVASRDGGNGIVALEGDGGPSAPENDVKCVGERAPPKGSAARSTGSLSGAAKRKSKFKRSASGSSNSANSPRKGKAEKRVVETRDVACQWDGSEMGDDDEAFFPQVQLPDTPDCRGLTAVLRLYDHARLENKRMGVVSSRPGWGVEEDIEKWEGVYLDTEDRVVALDVDGDPENRQAVLIGPLPVQLAEMDHLEQLTLRRHRFKGRIPGEIGQLTRLTHLNLSDCRLIGFIPQELGQLVNLVVLNLSRNFLSGQLPAILGKLKELKELLLNSNALSGSIPPELGKMRMLQRFNAGHNIGISGPLPPEMYRMTQLAVLDLRHNKISGRIPPIYGRLTNLEQLWLQNNEISGEIPAELARLPKLQMLEITNNKLSGVIPMALRGHPKYRAFKILAGNIALGERVAPNEKEVEAATRRMPSKDAMAHASGAHAQAQALQRAQQQQEALRRVNSAASVSSSPSFEGPYPGPLGRRQTVGGSEPSSATSSVVDGEEGRRRNSGRGGVSRRIRSMRRIMGKKQTPPTSPGESLTGVREHSLSPVARILTPGAGGSFTSPSSEMGAESRKGHGQDLVLGGKVLLEETADEMHEGNGDTSPDCTETMSTGNAASSHASPMRNGHDEDDGHDLHR